MYGGSLSIEGAGEGAVLYVAVAGFQLEIGVPIPVPDASALCRSIGWLTLGLLLLLGHRRRTLP